MGQVSRLTPFDLARIYVLILGTGLLLEGASLFVIGAIPLAVVPPALTPLFTAFQPDPPHDALHVVWGIALLGLPWVRPATFRPETMAIVFGVFYIGLGFLGVFVHWPFGLRLDLPQNVFHLTVGPLALVLGLWARAWLHQDNALRTLDRPS
jgi:hypothetical protein